MDARAQLQDELSNLDNEAEIIGLKAEFEAEGARFNDLVSFSGKVHRANLELVIKIGGCEAISDLHQSMLLGATKVVAPMIESTFALKKFAQALEHVYGSSRSNWPHALFNVETAGAMNVIEDLSAACRDLGLHGIVVGRGDLAESMGLDRRQIEDPGVLDFTRRTLEAARERDLVGAFGGGVSTRTLSFVTQLSGSGLIDYFETRKVLIKPRANSTSASLRKSILSALRLELLWLEVKRALYTDIVTEDDARIERLASLLEQG